MDGLTAELVERTATLFQADAACLLLRDENAPGLGVHAIRGRLPLPVEGRVMLGEGPFGRLAVERQPALLVGEDVPGGRAAGDAGAGEGVEEGAIVSVLAVPLVAADELLGLVVLGATAEDRFDAGDLELLSLAADRMAIAIDHVQRFAHGRQLVETLQRSLLPDRLPHHPRLELAAR
jgi:phosphoserine phosphatase RsbU/P